MHPASTTSDCRNKGLITDKFTWYAAGGLTEADMTAFSQPIPDKFWSKMGRKMSSQRKPNLAAYRSNVQNWFHEDDGTVSSTGLPPARPSKKSFEEEVRLSAAFKQDASCDRSL